ncbi:hypothetical protein MKW92_011525, partial [Papaver armeniacum]
MFSLFYGVCKYVFSKTEFHVLILADRIVPTVGLNIGRIEASNTKIIFWDLGGQSGLRPIWEKYFEEAHAIIYVIDVASHRTLKIQYLLWVKKLLRHEDLQGGPSSDRFIPMAW